MGLEKRLLAGSKLAAGLEPPGERVPLALRLALIENLCKMIDANLPRTLKKSADGAKLLVRKPSENPVGVSSLHESNLLFLTHRSQWPYVGALGPTKGPAPDWQQQAETEREGRLKAEKERGRAHRNPSLLHNIFFWFWIRFLNSYFYFCYYIWFTYPGKKKSAPVEVVGGFGSCQESWPTEVFRSFSLQMFFLGVVMGVGGNLSGFLAQPKLLGDHVPVGGGIMFIVCISDQNEYHRFKNVDTDFLFHK